ncbi:MULTISPECIES: hypothetical protein [Halostella]|uniref:hypothetical protein n=1 Tax=Halostella TaxID=1843185 RepID=UPI0010817AA0|nr:MULTISPECIES: hypothetical protein [Halostella]
MKKTHSMLLGLHITIIGGFLLIEDVLVQLSFGGARASTPYTLLYGGLLVTLASLAWYALSDGTADL